MEHFMSNDNANSVLSEYASKIKTLVPTEITWANYQLLTEEQKASKRWLIIDYPDAGGDAVFTITLTGDGDETPYSVDKTPAEVIAAYDAGKVLLLHDSYEDDDGQVDEYITLKDITRDGAEITFAFEDSPMNLNNGDIFLNSISIRLISSDSVNWENIIVNSDWVIARKKFLGPAKSVNEGQVIHYIGATNTNYKHGYFYECVQTSSDPVTYEWQQIDVQPSVDVSDKADKVTGATNGNFAGLDANGNLVDSGKKASDFLTEHQDISGKADKVTSATNGNFASLDSNGNLADSGKKASDFMADGTVSVSKGGTGATTLTSGAALIGNGTSAVSTRAITNNTSKSTAPSGSTNLATMNSLLYGMQNYNNRASAVNSADTNYTTAMARAIYATTSDLTPGSTALTNGTIALVYE